MFFFAECGSNKDFKDTMFFQGHMAIGIMDIFRSNCCFHIQQGCMQIFEISHSMESCGISPRCCKTMENERNGCSISDTCTCLAL